MKPSEFYYGKNYDAKTLRELTYPQALLRKNIWAKELLEELEAMPLYIDSEGERYAIRDSQRAKRVAECIKDNYRLYDECYGKEIE